MTHRAVCWMLRRPQLLIVAGILVSIASLSFINAVKAGTVESAWSWSVGKPIVFSSTVISGVYANSCKGTSQKTVVIGELDQQQVCMLPGEKVRFATYYSGNIPQPVISFGFDNKMYKVWGACDMSNSCLYLPGSDSLVTKQYLINGIVRSLVVYKNFTKRLSHAIRGLSLGYDFDTSNPDYTFRSDSGYAWPIGGYGASGDGKWLAIEFRQRGIGLLNIDTLEMKRISTMSFSYGTGYDPTSEIAVSNGGKGVAIVGQNSGITVLEVGNNCGDEATDDRMSEVRGIAIPCKTSPIDTGDFIYRFHTAYSPRFNDDGGELSFYTSSYVGESKEVSLRASGYISQRLDYLALGDSFSSGEGETDDYYYLQDTNDEFEKCHVSTRSYPYLLAGLSKIDLLYMKSVACSGATTDDIVGIDSGYWGQGARLGAKNMNLNKLEKTLYQTQAIDNFIPGRIHQLGFISKYQPKVVTIGVGGNDAGFMDKLKACMGTDICSWANNLEDREQTANEIQNLFGTLVKTYQRIHDESPNSYIYAVGYPKIINEGGTCNLVIGKLLNDSEKRFMNEGVMYMNKVISAAARSVGIKYLDIQNSFGDHALCGHGQPNAMNAIITGDDIAVSDNLAWLKLLGQESFHPTPFGHTLSAYVINESIGKMLDYRYCTNNVTACPVETVAPEPSEYWIPDIHHNYATQKIANYVYDRDNATNFGQKQIQLDDNSLAPNSNVDVEITSNPISLGQYTAAGDGSLNTDIDLPTDLENGYHTVHLYGISYSGESIELYQVIKYSKPAVVTDIPVGENTNTDENVSPVTVGNINTDANTDLVTDENPGPPDGSVEPVRVTAKSDKIKTENPVGEIVYESRPTLQTSGDVAVLDKGAVKGASILKNTAEQSKKSSNQNTNQQTINYVILSAIVMVAIVSIVVFIWRIRRSKE